MQHLLDRVVCSDAFDLFSQLPDASIDSIITDPPYGQGLDTWDKPIDIGRFLCESYRVLKEPGFLAFTMTMPYLEDWIVARRGSQFQHHEQIAWIKRVSGNYAKGLSRSFENILIWNKGKAKYFKTKGLYQDVKLPGVLVDAISLGAIDRYISHLRREIKTGIPVERASGINNELHKSRRNKPSFLAPELANFTTVWSFRPNNNNTSNPVDHPSVKPIPLLERLIDLLTPDDGLVFDPFVGSGSTFIAARNRRKHFIGGDISQTYIDLANKRLADPHQFDMFTSDDME